MAVASSEVLLLGLVGCRSSSQVKLFPEKLSTSPSPAPAAISLKLCSRQTAALRRRLAPVQAQRISPSESGGPVFYPHRFAQVLSFLQTLPNVRARCRQTEQRYGKKLSSAPTPLVTTADRVEGIPASYNTFVHAYLDPEDPSLVYFYAHSDAAHVRGLAAILVKGLSGSPVRTIAGMSLSSFALLIGQNLLPARWCTHFMLLLEHMQRKACHLIKTNTSMQNYYNSNAKYVLSIMGLGDPRGGLKDENHEIHQIHVVYEFFSTIGLGVEVHHDDDDDVHVDLKNKKIYDEDDEDSFDILGRDIP